MRIVYLFLILITLSIVLSILVQSWVLTDEVIYYTFREQISNDRIEKFLKKRHEWAWLGYAFIFVLYGIKIILISLCLFIGMFLFDGKAKLLGLLRVAVKAEFVFLIPSLFTLIQFTLIKESYTLQDVRTFAPLSLYGFFGDDVEFWLIYPLKVLSLFEVAYILTLALGFSEEFELNFSDSLKRVFFSYGTGLVLWVVFIVFLNVNFSS
jgi:hypothetical protein